MRVADFFCGGGGFSEGFRQAGYDIVFAVDKWAPAVKTYQGNKPGVNVIQDDVIKISLLPDDEFEKLLPDSEVIIGSPPYQSFSHSNKSGGADKSLGIKLIEAYLRIIARKKYKPNSVLRYWILENVPAVKNYIKEEYTADDLGLEGAFTLRPHDGASGKYNAKYFGAPTNRERYLCGEFPRPVQICTDETVTTIRMVQAALGRPQNRRHDDVTDINYPDLVMPRHEITDHHYIYELAAFEYETAKRLKQDKGYMGKMSFPENIDKPSRTVMATMSASSRESMIFEFEKGRYRLPTVREAACFMSFPIDYRFYGDSKATKHTLVGNAVPPKMSYALAVAIARAENEPILDHYPMIHHDDTIPFFNLNGATFPINAEKPKRAVSKFKYHIPYMIINAYRVELTNYHSDFENEDFRWDAEIHYSQGKIKAKSYTPAIELNEIPEHYQTVIRQFLNDMRNTMMNMNDFQRAFCMTSEERQNRNIVGPYELLNIIKQFIDENLPENSKDCSITIKGEPYSLPLATVVGYYLLSSLIEFMGG